jgi:hypothetical protein
MNKPYLRSAIATFGILAGTLVIEGQSGAGAAGGAAAGGAASGTAATGSAAVNSSGTAASTGGRATPAGTVNTFGGASALEANPNNLGSSQGSGITAPAAPGTVQGQAAQQTAAQMNSLPTGVQTTLGTFAANGSLGSVSQIPGQPGTYRATVTQNGVPMEITVGPNGQILSRTPVTGSGGVAANSGTVSTQPGVVGQSVNGVGTGTVPFISGGGGAVLPPTAVVMDELPNSIQEAVRAQLAGAEVSRILQQRTPNGVNYLVSYDQNGRQMILVVGPDGRIISNGPAAPGSSAAAVATTGRSSATNATRTSTMTLDELPNDVENSLKQIAPYAEVRTVTREQRVGGDVYVVSVRDGDRAGEITFDDDGKVIRDTRRDLSALTASAPTAARDPEKPEGMPYDTLPVAIKNAVRAYASSSDIRSITLGADNDGRTVYDVVFYRDGRRDRMIVRKDGTLVRIEENVSPVFELASSKPAVLAVGDLPQPVQDTVRRQTDNVMIKEINTKEVANQTVYSVRWETNGAPVELLVSRDGTVIQPEGSAEGDLANAPTTAPLDREEAAVVKVVDATPGTARATENVGAAARSESGVTTSVSVSSDNSAGSVVALTDAPKAVQDTAKKLAGAGTIESVSPKLDANGMVYEVRYMENGQPRTVWIGRDGQVQPLPASSKP